eukprot:CAMPEP_0174255292 /NCGR_PEP_ID=MMETSP0439-20130205/4639_1 /TAXON_ID=0 /ORGANISM="Stereomyxa ramosa, Strain Chinc5" /LENGTH=950 /DNA_ID=CAMNT_0015337415 /DNA_START=280 /DNA_END=3132 /DNA_ORIENTATION=+
MTKNNDKVLDTILRLDENFDQIAYGHTSLTNMYFRELDIETYFGGWGPIIRGAMANPQAEVDVHFADAVRNEMFNSRRDVSQDLIQTNIERGRDHHIPSYIDCADQLIPGHSFTSFEALIEDEEVREIMRELYEDDFSAIDPFIGGLLEPKAPNANFGPSFKRAIIDQLTRTRDGDRFWYERDGITFTADEIAEIYSTTLPDLFAKHMGVEKTQDNPFFLTSVQLANFGAGDDGFFPNDGTYANFLDLSPAYRVSWNHVRNGNNKRAEEVVQFQIQVRTAGWAGFGLYPYPNTMKGADIMLCRQVPGEDGVWEFRDSKALDVGIPALDEDLGGTNDFFDTSASLVDGILTCRWSRNVETGDEYDHDIRDGDADNIIFAFHPDSYELAYHGPTRSAAISLDLLDYPDEGDGSSDNTGAIIGGVLGAFFGLCCLLLLVLLILAILFYARKKDGALVEEELLLATTWEDDEFIDNEELVRAQSLSLIELEEANITFEPEVLRFGLDENDKCPVDQEVEDHIRITNNGSKSRTFVFFVPSDPERFICTLHPGYGTIGKGETIDVTVKMKLLITTTVRRKLKFEIEGFGSYLPQIDLTGDLSTKLDPDDIVTYPPPIGSGSFGAVYRGSYKGNEVAVKILKCQIDPRSIAEFEKEVELMTRLRSPYVLHFVGSVSMPGKVCLVTEMCPKGSLGDIIFSDKKLYYDNMLKYATDMAKGLNFLHSNGIMHRDIKPDNFLVISKSLRAPVSCKVADFGTSRSIKNEYEVFNHTAGLGTPIYMAPEILDRQSYNLSVDVYSFGIMLWVLYCRIEPYTEFERQWDIPRYVLDGGRPPIPDSCPSGFAEIMEECWAQDPHDRPSTSDIVDKLTPLLDVELKRKGIRRAKDLPSDAKPKAMTFDVSDGHQHDAISRGNTNNQSAHLASTWDQGFRGPDERSSTAKATDKKGKGKGKGRDGDE